MKRVSFFSLLLTLAVCLSVCSCNSEPAVIAEEKPVDAFEELEANLQAYNAEFAKSHPETRRGFFQKIDKFCKS